MNLAADLAAGRTVMTAWSGLPSVDIVDALARTAYDAVTLDMQHGAHVEASVHAAIPAIVAQKKAAIVRIPVGRNDVASRAADFGAEAVIAPMINSVEEARAFAAAMKYPPGGERSWGPGRAMQVHGIASLKDYLASANAAVLTFAMIETRRALDALDAILAVNGIDGVFVGPSDFSISWTGGQSIDPELPDMMPAIAAVAAKAKAAGKHAAIFSMSPATVPSYVAMGYRLIASGTDGAIIARGAAAILEAGRG